MSRDLKPGQGEPVRVLLVDDEPDIIEPVRFCLEQEGYDVQTAGNGHEALGAIRSWLPQVVLLDVMLPRENGYRVSRFVKNDVDSGVLPPTKVLLVTARKLDDPDRERTFAEFSRADGVVYKPFDLDALIETVHELARAAAAEPVSVG